MIKKWSIKIIITFCSVSGDVSTYEMVDTYLDTWSGFEVYGIIMVTILL